MNTTWKTGAALGLATAALATLGWGIVAQAAPPTPAPVPPAATATATADSALVKNLTFMREEEKLTRDLYAALAEKHSDAAPFVNISAAEQRHFDAMGLLLARYGIADPAAGQSTGSYADASLQTLYDQLLATGSESLEKAYDVGITIENKDIADLKVAITETTQADAKAAFTNLMNGSEHHLAAFTAAKDGKILATHDGQGMQNGRATHDGQAMQNGQGTHDGQGMQNGQRRMGTPPTAGNGQPLGVRAGRAGNVDRPATCPVR